MSDELFAYVNGFMHVFARSEDVCIYTLVCDYKAQLRKQQQNKFEYMEMRRIHPHEKTM